MFRTREQSAGNQKKLSLIQNKAFGSSETIRLGATIKKI